MQEVRRLQIYLLTLAVFEAIFSFKYIFGYIYYLFWNSNLGALDQRYFSGRNQAL